MGDFIIKSNVLTKYVGTSPYVNIPDGVIGISESAFLNRSYVKDVSIPNTVTFIGDFAFDGCHALARINIPEGVTSIAHMSFKDCVSLTEISIPKSLIHIDGTAFAGCTGLTDMVIDPDNGSFRFEDGVLYTKDGKKLIHYTNGKTDRVYTVPEGVTDIGHNAFMNCTALTEVHLPNSLIEIGDSAFRECTALIELTVPEGVKIISEAAFSGCSSLEKITLADSVNTIGNQAFSGCVKLNGVTVPDGVTFLGDGIFSQCAALNDFTIPKKLLSNTVTIGDFTVRNSKLISYKGSSEHVTVPAFITDIGQSAFSRKPDLKSVSLPEGLTAICKEAFAYCPKLTAVTFPIGIKRLGESAFDGSPISAPLNIRFDLLPAVDTKSSAYAWAGAVRGFLSRFYSEKVDKAEADQWRKYLGKLTKRLFDRLPDEPLLYRYVTDQNIISTDRAKKLIGNTKDPQCRAILLDYVNRRSSQKTSADDIITKLYSL